MTNYAKAQQGISLLKDAVYSYLHSKADAGATNAEIGRALGIYTGHVGHEGHISRTILGLMESEEVVVQDEKTKLWSLKKY